MSTYATPHRASDHIRTIEIADLLARLAVLITKQSPTPELPESPPMPARVLLTVEEAAEQLSIGRTLLYRLIADGEIESIRIGRLRRIPATAIQGYARKLSDDKPSERAA